MTNTQGRQGYLDVAKGMGILGVVASHCLVQTDLGVLSDWYGFFMLAIFYVYTGWRYALRYGTGNTGISTRDMAKRRLVSLGIPYVCYSVLFIVSRVFLVWPQQYTFLVLMSDIYYTGTLVGLETLWFLPSIFIAELLLNAVYGRRGKMAAAACLTAGVSIVLILYINMSRQDTTLWRVIHLPIMVYIKGLVGFVLALGGVFACDAWKKACQVLKGGSSLALSMALLVLGITLTVYIPGCDFNYLTMKNPVSWILTAWFSSASILMFGQRVSLCQGRWKEWWAIKKVLIPFFTYYGKHSLTIMCTHLVPVIAFFKVAAGKALHPGILSGAPWDIMLLAVVLAVEVWVVRLIETRLPWINGKKREKGK